MKSSGASEDLEKRVRALLTELAMAERLEEARLTGNSVNRDAPFDLKTTAREYAEAFRDYGIDVESLEPSEAAERIIGQRVIREHLTVALDHWASLSIVDIRVKKRLLAIVTAA